MRHYGGPVLACRASARAATICGPARAGFVGVARRSAPPRGAKQLQCCCRARPFSIDSSASPAPQLLVGPSEIVAFVASRAAPPAEAVDVVVMGGSGAMGRALQQALQTHKLIEDIGERGWSSVPAGSCAAVVCADMFHLAPATVAAAHRALAPGGTLACVWHSRDPAGSLFMAQLEKGILDPLRPAGAAGQPTEGWRAAFGGEEGAAGLFGEPEHRQAKIRRPIAGDKLLELVAADELVAGLGSAEEKDAVVKAVGELIYAGGYGCEALQLHSTIDCFVFSRLGS